MGWKGSCGTWNPQQHKLNIVGIKKNEKLNVEIDPKMPLEADMILIAIGKNKDLNKVTK